MKSSRSLLTALAVAALSCVFLAACQSDPSKEACAELSVDARNWKPDAIMQGGMAAGVPLKLVKSDGSSGLYEGEDVKVSYDTDDGKVKVKMRATSPEMVKKLPALSNGIGMALVPKDKVHQRAHRKR